MAACHSAGVKVVMVTGDHPITAASIGRKIGLVTKPTRDILALQRDVPKEQVRGWLLCVIVIFFIVIDLISFCQYVI